MRALEMAPLRRERLSRVSWDQRPSRRSGYVRQDCHEAALRAGNLARLHLTTLMFFEQMTRVLGATLHVSAAQSERPRRQSRRLSASEASRKTRPTRTMMTTRRRTARVHDSRPSTPRRTSTTDNLSTQTVSDLPVCEFMLTSITFARRQRR